MIDVNLSGWWDDHVHYYPLRVYYADTDAAGLVYHSAYLDFAERARSEMIRLVDPAAIGPTAERSATFVVRACEIDYKRPAKLDDLLVVRSRLIEISAAGFKIEQQVCRDDRPVVGLVVALVCIRNSGTPTRIPASLREKMTGYLK